MRFIRATLIAIAVALVLFVCVAWIYVQGMSSVGYGIGTPPDSRTRGDLFRVIHHGPFNIELRSYKAGSGSGESRVFCDYWIEFRGKPVDLSEHANVNGYNSCGAIALVEAEQPTFILGSHFNANGDYMPILISEREGKLVVEPVRECIFNAINGGQSQAWLGWNVEDGKLRLCEKTWNVRPFT